VVGRGSVERGREASWLAGWRRWSPGSQYLNDTVAPNSLWGDCIDKRFRRVIEWVVLADQ